jgi:CheY-like chemotaxis protein
LGLGLATVKRLGQIMQMPIELHSRPGRGTVFSLTLPACVPRPPEPVLPASTPTVDLGGLVVLVIDDERAILDGIEWLLQSWGCIVTCAENVEQARAALAASPAPPDLVKALLVTGETAPERLREIDGSGVPVLHKPVPPARLREALAATLAGRGAAD